MNAKQFAKSKMQAKIEETNEFSNASRKAYLAQILNDAGKRGAKLQYFLASFFQQESVKRGNTWDEFVNGMLYDFGTKVQKYGDKAFPLSEKQVNAIAENLSWYVGREDAMIEQSAKMFVRPLYDQMIAMEG